MQRALFLVGFSVLLFTFLFACVIVTPWLLIHARSALHWWPIIGRTLNHFATAIGVDHD